MPSSQAAAILRDLKKHATAFNLDSDGFGDALMNAAAEGMFDQALREVDPDGTPWPELSADYAKAKAKAYPGEQIGEREHIMLSLQEFDGEREIEATSGKQIYGVNEQAREEADYFITGDPARNRPARKFYELDAETVKRLDEVVEKRGKRVFG